MHAYSRAHERTLTTAAMTLAMGSSAVVTAVVMAASPSAINTKVVK